MVEIYAAVVVFAFLKMTSSSCEREK